MYTSKVVEMKDGKYKVKRGIMKKSEVSSKGCDGWKLVSLVDSDIKVLDGGTVRRLRKSKSDICIMEKADLIRAGVDKKDK